MRTVLTEKRATLTDAVKALRGALGDTQQQFAQRLGMAISTVVRYESTRPPKGKALSQLFGLALSNGLHDVAEMFRRALLSDLGSWDTTGIDSIGIEPTDDAERLCISALLATLRNPQYVAERAKILPALRPAAVVCIEALEAGRKRIRNTIEVDRLLDEGMDAAAIAKKLNLEGQIQQIRTRASIKEMVRKFQELAVEGEPKP
jgi:transcriptional regulator with XRE-family HTH domain